MLHDSQPEQQPTKGQRAPLPLTEAQHLAAAKRLLTLTPSERLLQDATEHLEAIAPGSSQYSEAKQLLKTISEKEKVLRQATATKEAEELESLRISLAKELEEAGLQEGVDMVVRAEGPNHTTLRITYTLMSRAFEYQYIHNEKFTTALRGARFKKLVFSNDLSTSPYYRVYKLE